MDGIHFRVMLSKEAVFTMKLEHALRDEFIQKHREKHGYDAWFKNGVKASKMLWISKPSSSIYYL